MCKKIYILVSCILVLSGCSSIKLAWDKDNTKGKDTICLTFDDGPNGIATQKLINVLDKYKVPATFFIIGENATKHPDLLKQIADKKYNIGNHSYNHDLFFFNYDKESVKKDILKTNEVISKITGKTPVLFRPPNGLYNDKIQNACKELDMQMVGTNIFINDPMLISENDIYKKVLNSTKSGKSILVLHDGFATIENPYRTIIADALNKLIPKLKKKGYEFGYLDDKGICN